MSIESYARDIKLIGHKAYPDGEPRLLESVLIKVFINGLRDDTSRERVLLYKPKTLTDAAQYARFSEAAVRVARGQSKVNATSVSAVNYTNQVFRNESSNCGYRGNWNSSKFRGRGHGPFRCYNCTGFGHIAKDCPTPSLEDEQSGTDQSSRKTVNRGSNGQNNLLEEASDARLEGEADDDATNRCEPEQAQDYSAIE